MSAREWAPHMAMVSSSSALSFSTYKMCIRDSPETFTAKKLGVCNKPIDCPEPKKVMLPKEGLEDLGNRVIRWSDLDGNGHVYSGNYGDIVWDALPEDLQERVPEEFYINYSKEATLGQELKLWGFRDGQEYRLSLIHI